MRTITSSVVIPTDRQLHISVLENVPPGPAAIVLAIVPESTWGKGLTGGELLRSPLFGIRKDRTDSGDGVEYARNLRAKAEQHKGIVVLSTCRRLQASSLPVGRVPMTPCSSSAAISCADNPSSSPRMSRLCSPKLGAGLVARLGCLDSFQGVVTWR
jgi:hypothetical protein